MTILKYSPSCAGELARWAECEPPLRCCVGDQGEAAGKQGSQLQVLFFTIFIYTYYVFFPM